jgi:hypothetical protein
VSLGTLALVLAQLVACIVVAWAAGAIVLERIEKRISAAYSGDLGTPERVLISALCFLALAILLMVGNIVTGGAIFGIPVLVPAACTGVALVALRKSRPSVPMPSRRHGPLIALAVALVAIYALPVLLTGSGVRTGDPPWHLGWTEQLLAGEAVPTGPAPEFGRNAYPWGFHAVLATMTRLVPGSDPLTAHESLHLLLIGLIPLAAACLARLVNRRAGLAAAWLAGLVGGFGWVASSSSAFVGTPTEARFGADLVVASPNSMYELFPPALPREVALVALGGAVLLLTQAIRSADRKLQVIAGGAMGAVGLLSVPMLMNAIAWAVAMCMFAIKKDRLRSSAIVLGSALGVFLLWAGPVIGNYFRYDGFVNITPQLGVEWELGVALASWGILLPLALGGVGVLLAQPRVISRSLLACFAGSAILLVLALVRARLDWGLFGNETLLHQGRIWPPLHLLGAAAGGLAVVTAFGWLRRRGRAMTAVAVSAAVLVGAASPVVAARGLEGILSSHTKGFDYAEPDLVRGSFMRRAASHLGPADVVEVQGSNELAFLLFQFSGTRLSVYDDPRLIGNELRIRYSDLAHDWDRVAFAEGFDADYVIRPTGGPLVAEDPIEEGRFRDQYWEMVPVDG